MTRIVAFALAIATSLVPARAAQESAAGKEHPMGGVSGVAKIDGKPAAGVHVMLLQANSSGRDKPVATAVTDSDGRYVLGGAPPGSYLVSAHAPAYVLEGATGTWFATGRSVSIGDDAVEGFDLVLTSGGVVTGRVTTAAGEPAIGERVDAIRVKPNGERERVEQGWPPRTTDDRGIYRLYGLDPGRYIVAVGRTSDEASPYASKYPRTYHPRALSVDQAEAVDVTAGGEVRDVDLVLTDRATTYTASGRAHYADGTPVVGAYLQVGPVVNGQLRSMVGSGDASDAKGAFQARGLAPGTYRIFLQFWEKRTHWADPLNVEITDHDVTGLDVTFEKGRSIAGVAAFDEDDERAAFARTGQSVTLDAQRQPDPGHEDEWDFGGVGRGSLNEDGTFLISGLKPGRYRVSAGWGGPDRRGAVYVWSVELGGTPVQDSLDVSGEADVEGARVHLRYGLGRVVGSVKLVGEPPAGLQLDVMLRKPDGTSGAYGPQVDDRRQFVVDNVPDGEFDAVAVGAVFGPNAKRYLGKPVRVTVRSGTAAPVEVVLDFEKDLQATGGGGQ